MTAKGLRKATEGGRRLRRQATALDVLLDLVLTDPRLGIRLEIDECGVDLIEHDALTSLAVLDGLHVALEHVPRRRAGHPA